MKRILMRLLLLSLCLLCFGCSKEGDTAIRYSGSAAAYTQEGAKYTMELHFENPVFAGSELCLLSGEETLLRFKAEADFSTLTISTLALEQNVAYRLTVDGILQCYGAQKTEVSPTDPGYIPDPTVVTIPQEPMSATEATTSVSDDGTDSAAGSSTDSTTETSFSFSTPPANFDPDLSAEELPTIVSHPETEADTSAIPDGTLPSEPFTPGKGESSDETFSESEAESQERSGYTTFILTGTFTRFLSVRDAS